MAFLCRELRSRRLSTMFVRVWLAARLFSGRRVTYPRRQLVALNLADHCSSSSPVRIAVAWLRRCTTITYRFCGSAGGR